MDLPPDNRFSEELPESASLIDPILKELQQELKSCPLRPDKILIQCNLIKDILSLSELRIASGKILFLLPYADRLSEELANPLLLLIESIMPGTSDPWNFLREWLSSQNEKTVLRALDLIYRLTSEGRLKISDEIIKFFADKAEVENSLLRSGKAFRRISEIIRLKYSDNFKSGDGPLLDIFISSRDANSRILAAKLLDEDNKLIPDAVIERLLGADAQRILSPYFIFTRVSFLDLLYLIPVPGKEPPVLDSVQKAEKICKQKIIQEVISRSGWKQVSYGFSVKQLVGITINGSLPLFLSESESKLFEKCTGAERVSEFFIFTTLGGAPPESQTSVKGNERISRFRSYNLIHAGLLRDLLDIAPLTADKVKSIIEATDRIVDDFIALFESYTEECKILPDVYSKIKNKILNELEEESGTAQLNAEITRLVGMFEDPQSMGGVHTLHGLKRYLHQKGLQLGLKLVEHTSSPNRSINIVLASKRGVLSEVRKINYADFEAESSGDLLSADIPYPVRIVVDGFTRQLLHGQESFPTVNIFCYGNEVHYFVWFRNHPVFIRMDLSPPLQGGMIDLQYFGVSNYEIAEHPNLNLDAIRIFFQYLEFDVQLDITRIHSRYDKERALDLAQLCQRAELLFCLVPYLMDLDWIIGSLNLSRESKIKVAGAWIRIFTRWGALPVRKLLTKDKLGILQEVVKSPEGETEISWNGEGEYRDRYKVPAGRELLDKLNNEVSSLGLNIPAISVDYSDELGQLYLEKNLLYQLREAVSAGEIIEQSGVYKKSPEDSFRRLHEAVFFADIMVNRKNELEAAVSVARIVIRIERTLKFQTTGSVENFRVQSAVLPLKGENLRIFILRDSGEIIRLGFFIYGNILYQKPDNGRDEWKSNAIISPRKLMTLLRQNNYTVSGWESSAETLKTESDKILTELNSYRDTPAFIKSEPKNTLTGMRASPGRTAGRTILGLESRLPEDYDDHILVASFLSPEDSTILFHAAGIAATGGGILSHAGLIATQFNKPALIISGDWKKESDGSLTLIYVTSDFDIKHMNYKGYRLSVFYDFYETEHQLREGDLVVLDATNGYLQALGQNRDTIALFEGLQSLGRTNECISKITDLKELLILRGKKLHIRHQIEKLLNRISDEETVRFVIHEILTGRFLEGIKSTPEERSQLLLIILNNNKVNKKAEEFLSSAVSEMKRKFHEVFESAKRNIPDARHPFEVLMPRIDVLQLHDTIKNATYIEDTEFIREINSEKTDVGFLDNISLQRLLQLRESQIKKIQSLAALSGEREYKRHLFRQVSRIDLLLKTPEYEQRELKYLFEEFKEEDHAIYAKNADKFILKPSDGSLALFALFGWKAANLAELESLSGTDLVPAWFAVTNKAFQCILDRIIDQNIYVSGENLKGKYPLRRAIQNIITAPEIENRDKSLLIRNLWTSISLPHEIETEVLNAYSELEDRTQTFFKPEELPAIYLALRSSSCEEDTETAARAGEFETYLFIKGKEQLLEYLKRTWSGLWTERAIHNRRIFKHEDVINGGGVIVQRMINSRVSGVLQTINVGKGELNEIVINAGLGLGEGIVSGRVAADQIIVSKEGDLQNGPLKFNYVTADKKERVIFNTRAGFGTVLVQTLYHQRFRPALEYVELCELVALASRLEDAYGYPLDIEFGIEGTRLWILQVRPVATFLPVLNATIVKYPLN